MEMDLKRLFIGMEVVAPWPEDLPEGRILREEDRHLTLAFLGETDASHLLSFLNSFPKPAFPMGIGAIFDRPLFLPQRDPHVAAWHIRFLEEEESFLAFQKNLTAWLKEGGLTPKEKKGDFLAHVTVARSPFVVHEWKETFQKLPLYLKDIHLCESLGHSKYQILWKYERVAPFEEFEHTADIAFRVRGIDWAGLYLHAQLALSFHFPRLAALFDSSEVRNIEEIVTSLNEMIFRADAKWGCPFKAVSFHGEMQKREFWEWEMIVDV